MVAQVELDGAVRACLERLFIWSYWYEDLVAQLQTSSTIAAPAHKSGAAGAGRDIHIADLENRLQQRFGSKVSLKYKKGKGSIEVRFFNEDDLDRILQIVGVTAG